MKRYHVNPNTGNPTVCRAEDPAACPFGGAAGHTLNPMECFSIYARVMADYVVPRVHRRRRPVSEERLAAILAWVNPCAHERSAVPDLSKGFGRFRGLR